MIEKKRNKLYLFLSIACLAGYTLLFYGFTAAGAKKYPVDVCIIKHTTDIPCPSCGSTRSVIAIMHGNFSDALFVNPLGYFIALFLLITPLWLIGDILTKSKSLFYVYKKIEAALRQPTVAIPCVALVLINWIWNITKGL